MSGEKWGYIKTYSGRDFYPDQPHEEDFTIADIAVGLSREARYNGQCSDFYSVAQHSVLMVAIVPDRHKLWALLHDASEAFLKDLPYPVKILCPEYKVMEKRLMRVIASKFLLGWPMPPTIKQADLIMLATEARDLLGFSKPRGDARPSPFKIKPWTHAYARTRFIMEYYKLIGE